MLEEGEARDLSYINLHHHVLEERFTFISVTQRLQDAPKSWISSQ